MSDSTAPIIAAKKPVMETLEEGKSYFWCACGLSSNQPFCDGSHAGSGIAPVKFTAEKSGPAALCACKGSGNQPFCDGSHGKMDAGAGDPVPQK